MTQGKIERYHRAMKNRILLDNYYLPGQLEQSIQEFVSYYNNCRYHESLHNLTPASAGSRPSYGKTARRPDRMRPRRWTLCMTNSRQERNLRVLTIVDTFSRFSPAIEPRFNFRGADVVEVLERRARGGLPGSHPGGSGL